MKVLIIGGVAAGTKVAAKLKRENRSCDVTILTKSKEISYAGCGLPYYVGKVISDRSQLIVNTPESFSKLTGVQILIEVEVIKVNPAEKTVDALDLNTKETHNYKYDKLVITSGADTIKSPVDGANLKGVFFMRTPDDAVALREAVESGEIKRAVVVGGGFIGLEAAENLSSQGVKVSVIDMAKHVLPRFDEEFAEYVENHLADQGIMTFTETKLEAILGEGKVEKIKTNKRALKTDAVILSVGIRANTAFLADTGIELMPNKTIKVNEFLQTNIEDIYAVGDCAAVNNKLTKEPAWSPMGSSANIAGRIAARNINGTLETMTPAAYAAGDAEGYRIIDTSLNPSIDGAPYVVLTKVNGELPEFAKDEKLLLVCTKGRRAYMLQNRLKYFGYTNTLVLEGGTTLNKVAI